VSTVERSTAANGDSMRDTPGTPKKIVAVPKARALAQELGVDLGRVQGSGEGGAILVDDVRAAAITAAPEVRRARLTAIDRSRIAALERSCRIPQFTQGILIDATSLEKAKAANKGGLSYMDFFLEAIVKAAAKVPGILARIGQDEIIYSQTLDISIATSTDAGLLIPVLRNAAAMFLEQRAPTWRRLVEGARAGTLTPQEMSGGIVALSNLGTRGVDYGTPLLPHGHSAIVFVGALAKRPMVVDDALTARPSLHVAVTFDHRVADGLLASRFTSALHEALITL
jgi:2-oxoisovalerate dehydrogenase E2 component (dihydrolipoyl transacylase)